MKRVLEILNYVCFVLILLGMFWVLKYSLEIEHFVTAIQGR